MSAVLAPICQVLVNIFFSARFRVEGDSMLPSLRHKQSVFVVRTRFTWNKLRRGDVAVFQQPGGIYIKRVVGLPGENIRISNGQIDLNGVALVEAYTQGEACGEEKEWFNGPNEYFLLGDNRADSNDSRAFGPVPTDLIIGRVWFRCWPPSKWGFIDRNGPIGV